jgi:ATP-dependent exoDNAse (exonuclease V) beta subunit
MIDEFQDDNELQKRLLFLIASEPGDLDRPSLAPDKLFFVGDEKQSIYLFRGADVSVFRRLSGELGTEAIPLSRNFRSEPVIIDMINAIFPSVMAPSNPDNGREDFEASFERLDTRESTSGVTPRFVYLELPYRDARGARDAFRDAAECEAWEVAHLVRDAVEGGSLLVADRGTGKARKARYEDFAILLRSTSKQVHFEKYLRLFGVPYGSENACGLFSEAVACDLYYALRLALYPDDRNALAAYLRSPFAGLSD